MNDLNAELTTVFGAAFDWQAYITGIAKAQATKFAKSGVIDDIVTDVVSDLFLAAKDGTLAVALVKAKEASASDAELLHNVKGVVGQAARFRASDARRKWVTAFRSAQFSQLGDGERAVEVAAKVTEDETDYAPVLVKELELMAQAAEWKSLTKLARRLRLAATIVPDRLAGPVQAELMTKYGIKSKATFRAVLDDIKRAVARVAEREQDPTLLAGVRQAA